MKILQIINTDFGFEHLLRSYCEEFTKFGHKILLELNKENGMVTQIPNDSYGMLISPLKKNTRILLLKQQDKYSWNSENVPNHIEKLVENAFEWYIKLKQKYNRISDITIEMIINGTI